MINISDVTADYFDAVALHEPPYKLRRFETGGKRSR